MKNILTEEEVNQLAQTLQARKKNIVLVGGSFDVLHRGHIALFDGAKQQGDVVVVFLESDESIRKRKGPQRPIHAQSDRAEVLTALKSVDYVVCLKGILDNQDYDKLTNTLQPAIIATTENDPGLQHKKRQAKEVGATVVFVNPLLKHLSTSNIAKAIQKEL